jgi:hypothetical protein
LGRIKAYIDALGYKSSTLLKTSYPHGLSLWGKYYEPEKHEGQKDVKAKWWVVYILLNPAVTKLAR